MRHTPTPWTARGGTIFAAGENAMSIAVATQHRKDATPAENAAFIVYAVNSHERILAALRELLKNPTGSRRIFEAAAQSLLREIGPDAGRVAYVPETDFGLLLGRAPSRPAIGEIGISTHSAVMTFARGTPDYEAMPRIGSLSFERDHEGWIYRWTGIVPVFDDDLGIVTITLPSVTGERL